MTEPLELGCKLNPDNFVTLAEAEKGAFILELQDAGEGFVILSKKQMWKLRNWINRIPGLVPPVHEIEGG